MAAPHETGAKAAKGAKSLFSAISTRLDNLRNRANHIGTQPISSIDSLSDWLLNGRKRGNHTGTQPISTVEGLDTALTAARARTNHTGEQPISSITNLAKCLQATGAVFALTAPQRMPMGVNTRVQFRVTSRYPDWINPTTSRITPKHKGIYLLILQVNVELEIQRNVFRSNTSRYELNILRNGVLHASGFASGYNEDYNTITVMHIAEMNGTTDYLEVNALFDVTNVTAANILSAPQETGFGILHVGDIPA